MTPRVCILLNDLAEFDFKDQLHRYLPSERFQTEITATFPLCPTDFQLIVPWSYRKIIRQAVPLNNILVMHSSNLPEGRGWAPIYHAFAEQKKEYVISGILADHEPDTGDIVIRAKFPMKPDYTASFIRKVDQKLSLIMIAEILQQWPTGHPIGLKQTGISSFRPRRYLKDNEIDSTKSLRDLIPILRGSEPRNKAHFYHEGVRYFIEIYPESVPSNPTDIVIEFPALGTNRILSNLE
jgi:methionyl-tRNA formyltransferase